MLYLRLAAQMVDLRLLTLHSRMRAVHVAIDPGEEPALLLIALLLRTHHQFLLGVKQSLSGLRLA